MSLVSRAVLAAAAAVLLVTAGGSAPPVPFAGHAAASPRPVAEVVSFGDSWTDAGTFGFVYGTAGSRSWAQLLAAMYGADQEPNRRVRHRTGGSVHQTTVGGLDYAEGGAVVVPRAEGSRAAPRSVPAQVAAFLHQPGGFTPGQLVTVWAGANDILSALSGSGGEDRARRFAAGQLTPAELAQASADVVAAARREAALVGEMLARGARWVAVLSVIDQGITAQAPGIRPGGNALASELTTTFNQALAEALPQDARVNLVDVAGLFAAVQAAPSAYGFQVVDGDACTNGGPRCGPDGWKGPAADRTYAFAGYGHFTAATRELIAGFVHGEVGRAWGW